MTDAATTPAKLKYGGLPIATLWAWIVTDTDGREAICRSPWSETAILTSPDEENINTPMLRDWCHAYYSPLGMTVELRRFDLQREAPKTADQREADEATITVAMVNRIDAANGEPDA
jgi:hypothetical protein